MPALIGSKFGSDLNRHRQILQRRERSGLIGRLPARLVARLLPGAQVPPNEAASTIERCWPFSASRAKARFRFRTEGSWNRSRNDADGTFWNWPRSWCRDMVDFWDNLFVTISGAQWLKLSLPG
ncbi:uncharacterized protein BDW70DRAFT_143882 [Aspergillus foveolatus]|uniref:uncharacterized protein n=1 Tax=Aspergillus foveolatus TaxID=210207 RepID=UPI003CCD0AC2